MEQLNVWSVPSQMKIPCNYKYSNFNDAFISFYLFFIQLNFSVIIKCSLMFYVQKLENQFNKKYCVKTLCNFVERPLYYPANILSPTNRCRTYINRCRTYINRCRTYINRCRTYIKSRIIYHPSSPSSQIVG